MDSSGAAFSSLVRRTPLVPAPALAERAGGDVRLKLESLQRTGSFKLRGASLRLDALSPEERRRGVVAASAGNHGQGVALAGRALGISVEVFVPESTPRVKRAGMEAAGAKVVVAGKTYDEAEHLARARATESGAIFVSPFDDDLVMMGNGGSLAEEILEDVADVGQVICPVGGGGLVAGLAQVLGPLGVLVVGVQPAGNCAMARSLELGRALTQYEGEPTLAEGCEGAVAERTFQVVREQAVRVALVDEAAIRRAMAFAYLRLGQVVEASAAVAIAAVLDGVVRPVATGPTVIVVSGGNVDPELLASVLA